MGQPDKRVVLLTDRMNFIYCLTPIYKTLKLV